ncbi:unnamed protein product [Caenorhabditis brenneri]
MSGKSAEPDTNHNQIKTTAREFVLKHVFKNVSKLGTNKQYWSDIEGHFRVPWSIIIKHNKDDLAVFLHCDRSENKKEWSIDTEFEIHVFHPSGNTAHKVSNMSYCFSKSIGYGRDKLMTWERMGKEFLLNDELVVEIRVKITEMIGTKVYLRRFDDEECSDVALVVDGKKFHVSKLYLASQSSYFKSMFLGKFNESGKSETELTGIDGYDLQKYLEMLYGEDALNDETAEGILHLADMYDTKTLIGRCEGYLLDVSRKALKEKLELSATYNLAELKSDTLKMSGETNTLKFVLKHVFKNVSTIKEAENLIGSTEYHFRVPWSIIIKHNEDHLGVYLYCDRSDNKTEWSIDTEFEIHVLHPSGNTAHKISDMTYCFSKSIGYGQKEFMPWEKMKEEYLINDELVVEIRVKITKMTGIEVYLRRFDDEECSDVALVVDGKKFHVSKLYLASQSPYFKSMFLGKFNESGKAEIELTGIDGYDLQKYLELLYGEDALNDETVGGILQLADMYDTKTLIGKCEKYLLEISEKSLKEKLQLSARYHLNELKVKCMSEIKSVDDVRSVIPEKIYDMNHTILADLLKKTLDFK